MIPTMRLRTAATAAAILATALLARADAAPARHPLPLHDGFYLNAEVDCGEAYLEAMLQVMGDRLEAGRDLCTIKSVSRRGTTFTLKERCQETDTGKTSPATLTLVVPDDHSLVLGRKAKTTRFRYCPVASLPGSFKDVDETVPDTPPFEEDR